MTNQDAVLAKLAAANPLPNTPAVGESQRVEAQRVLHRVLSAPTARRRPTRALPRLVRRSVSWLALVPAAAIAIAVFAVFTFSGPRTAAPAGASLALGQAAAAAAAGSDAPPLLPGEAWEVRATLRGSLAGEESVEKLITASSDFETAARSSGLRRTFRSTGLAASGVGFGEWDPNTTTQVPDATRAVLRYLRTEPEGYWNYTRGNTELNDTDHSAFTTLAQIAALLGEEPLRPASRAALYRAAASLPGLEYLGQVRDSSGRTGVAVAERTSTIRPFGSPGRQAYRLEMIFDPRTGTLLESRTIALEPVLTNNVPAGATVFSITYAHTGLLTSAQVPRRIKLQIADQHARRAAMLKLRKPGEPCYQADRNPRTTPSQQCRRALQAVIRKFP